MPNDIPVQNDTRNEVFKLLDNLFKTHQKYSVGIVHRLLPHIKSRSCVHKYLKEWKVANKETLDYTNRQFMFSPTLGKLLNNEISLFFKAKEVLFEEALRSANEQTEIAVLDLKHLEDHNSDLSTRVNEYKKSIMDLNQQLELVNTEHVKQIEKLSNNHKNTTDDLSLKLVGKNAEIEAFNKENKDLIRVNARIESKLEQKVDALSTMSLALENAATKQSKSEILINEHATTIAATSEKLTYQIKLNESLEASVSRIPELEKHLIELPALTAKVLSQDDDIAVLTEQLSKEKSLKVKAEGELKKNSDLEKQLTKVKSDNDENAAVIKSLNKKISGLEKSNKALLESSNDSKNSSADEDLLELYNAAKNDADLLQTLNVEQKTTIEEQAKLIAKLTKT